MLTIIRCKASNNIRLGFLKPNGQFIDVPWGKHETFAGDLIRESGWTEEREQFLQNKFNPLFKDFIVVKKGWVAFNCPCDDNETFIQFSPFKVTKRQRKFIENYLMDINDFESLNKFYAKIERSPEYGG